MTNKIDFRQHAREHFKVASKRLDDGDEDLLAAALRLRMAIECLAYELLQSFEDEFARIQTWQPRKLIQELKEIDPWIENDRTISIRVKDGLGEHAEETQSLGTDKRLSASWIKKNWNALGSYLHEPTIKQYRDNNLYEPQNLREKIIAIAREVERILDSQLFAVNINEHFTVTCECGHTIKRRKHVIECDRRLVCAGCKTVWGAEIIEDKLRFKMLYLDVICQNCNAANKRPLKEPLRSFQFSCIECEMINSVEKDWCVRIKPESAG